MNPFSSKTPHNLTHRFKTKHSPICTVNYWYLLLFYHDFFFPKGRPVLTFESKLDVPGLPCFIICFTVLCKCFFLHRTSFVEDQMEIYV